MRDVDAAVKLLVGVVEELASSSGGGML
jgi:hypothetical protein